MDIWITKTKFNPNNMLRFPLGTIKGNIFKGMHPPNAKHDMPLKVDFYSEDYTFHDTTSS